MCWYSLHCFRFAFEVRIPKSIILFKNEFIINCLFIFFHIYKILELSSPRTLFHYWCSILIRTWKKIQFNSLFCLLKLWSLEDIGNKDPLCTCFGIIIVLIRYFTLKEIEQSLLILFYLASKRTLRQCKVENNKQLQHKGSAE